MLECRQYVCRILAGGNIERGVRALVLEVERPDGTDAPLLNALLPDLGPCFLLEFAERRLELRERARVEDRFDGLLAKAAHVGETHAVGRQHTGERMDEHTRHAERVGDRAGVLPARAAEAAQRVFGDVIAARHGDVLDRVRHVLDGDLEEAVRDLFLRPLDAGRRRDLAGECCEFLADDVGIERRVAVSPEHFREQGGIELADHDVAVGDRERTAAPVRRRAGIRTCGLGADAKACAVERADRSTTCSHRVDAHHRRAQPDAGHFGRERPLVVAGPVRDVGRRAAHVEADDPVEARKPGNLDRADDAARRTGQDRVLALEQVRVRQPARALHELQPRRGRSALAQVTLHLPDVAPQDRRQVRIHDRRVAARDEFHQRRDDMRHRDLGEADASSDVCKLALVVGIAVAMHQHDRDGADALVDGLRAVRAPQPPHRAA